MEKRNRQRLVKGKRKSREVRQRGKGGEKREKKAEARKVEKVKGGVEEREGDEGKKQSRE